MSRYYQKSPNKSPGFIYFNANASQESPNKPDTSEFVAFNDSAQASPQSQRFQPAYYSSPQSKFHRGSPRSYPPQRYQRWSGGSGGNRSFNSTNNSSFSHNNSSTQEDDPEANISKFLHPSFLEDPWAPLEASLRERTRNSEANDSGQSKMED